MTLSPSLQAFLNVVTAAAVTAAAMVFLWWAVSSLSTSFIMGWLGFSLVGWIAYVAWYIEKGRIEIERSEQ